MGGLLMQQLSPGGPVMFLRRLQGFPTGHAFSHLGRCGQKPNKPPTDGGDGGGGQGRLVPRSEALAGMDWSLLVLGRGDSHDRSP